MIFSLSMCVYVADRKTTFEETKKWTLLVCLLDTCLLGTLGERNKRWQSTIECQRRRHRSRCHFFLGVVWHLKSPLGHAEMAKDSLKGKIPRERKVRCDSYDPINCYVALWYDEMAQVESCSSQRITRYFCSSFIFQKFAFRGLTKLRVTYQDAHYRISSNSSKFL